MEHSLINSFIQIYQRDMGKLEAEVAQYSPETHLWKTAGEINNPPGNLCLHLCGNLHLSQHFGYHLGQINYHRRLIGYCASGAQSYH